MKQDRKMRFSNITAIVITALLFMAFCFIPADVSALSMSEGFDPRTRLPAVLSTGTLHQSELYSKNSDVVLEIPGVARLMTLYLATERIPQDELIVISRTVEWIDAREGAEDRVPLLVDDKLPLRFLLLKMLFDNSDAAAIAIAEHVSGTSEDFLLEMQNAAQVLGMTQTEFFQVDIARTERESEVPEAILLAIERYDEYSKEEDPEPLVLPESEEHTQTARTTLRDLQRLLTALHSNVRSKALLSVSEELIQITSKNTQQIVAMRSPAAHFMTLSENRMNYVFLHLSDRYSLLCCVGTSPGGLPVMTVAVNLRQAGITTPTLQLYSDLDDFYTKSPLTRAGEKYPGAPEKAENGELFDLIYLDSVDYIHPQSDHFLEQTLDYLGNAPYPIPLQKNTMTGQVVFTLKNDIRIRVRVGSDRDILADNGLISRGLILMTRNPNLAYTIAGLSLILIMALLVMVIREMISLRYWIRLQRIELNAQAARAILFGDKNFKRNRK
jgi:hypothetical protein